MRANFKSRHLIIYCMILTAGTMAIAQTMSLSPHKIVLNAQGQAEDIQAIIGMVLPGGYVIADFQATLYFNQIEIAQAVGVDYCAIDDNLFVLFDPNDILQNPDVQDMAGTVVLAQLDGWLRLEREFEDPILIEFEGFDFAEIHDPDDYLEITKSAAAPTDDILLSYDTDLAEPENLLLMDRGQGSETSFGQTFRFEMPVKIDKITVKMKRSLADISDRGLQLRLGNAVTDVTDTHLTSLMVDTQANLPEGIIAGQPWYITLDMENQTLAAGQTYGFQLRFASAGDGQGESMEAYLWAMGRYTYDDGAAFVYDGISTSTLLNNELVFYMHGKELTQSPIPGDFDIDFDVDLADFARLSANWLRTECGTCDGLDLSMDNNVSMEDLALFLFFWLEKVQWPTS